MKILVVDDEKIILQGIAKLLKANSLVSEVYCAEDAFIALDFLKCHRVDVVVTDIRMPEMDGLEFIKEAKKQNFCNDFIILSGYAEFKYAQKAISYQVSEYILKPVEPDELNRAIQTVYHRKKSYDNTKVNIETLMKKIREKASDKNELEKLQTVIIELPEQYHPQSQKVRKLLQLVLFHIEQTKYIYSYVISSGFAPEETVANNLFKAFCNFGLGDAHPSAAIKALLITMEQYTDPEMCLDYVAKQLFMNTNYLSGLISKSIGISFHNFVRLLRVSYAQELLKSSSDYSIQMIGYKSGFGNTNMFFRTFRDITKMTPKSYQTGGK